MIKLIMAMDKNRLIGKNGKLPWHVSGDLKHDKETTINHTILMGQVSFENMPKLLPNRTYWILTNDQKFIDSHPELICLTSIEEVVNKARLLEDDLYVSGGASVYRQLFPYADEVILSVIEGEYEGDAYLAPFEDNFILYKVCQKEGFEVKFYKRGE